MTNAVFIQHADGRTYLRTGECDGCQSGPTPGLCCTFLVLPLARPLSPDEKRWVELHPGLSVEGQNVRFDVACSALDEGGRCTLLGSGERPELCGRYPELPVQVLPGCAYSLEEIT